MKKSVVIFSILLILVSVSFVSLVSFVSALPGLGGDCSDGAGCDTSIANCFGCTLSCAGGSPGSEICIFGCGPPFDPNWCGPTPPPPACTICTGSLLNGLINYWPLDSNLNDVVAGNDFFCNDAAKCGPEYKPAQVNDGLEISILDPSLRWDAFYDQNLAGEEYISSQSNINGHQTFSVSLLFERDEPVAFNTGDGEFIIDPVEGFYSLVYSDRNGQTQKVGAPGGPVVRTLGGHGSNYNVDISPYLKSGMNHIVFVFDWSAFDINTCAGRHAQTEFGNPVFVYVNGVKLQVNYGCDVGQVRVSPRTWVTDLGFPSPNSVRSTVDEIGYWDRALTDAEVQELYRVYIPFFGNSLDNGLVSMWTMDQSDGSLSTLAKDVIDANDGGVLGGTSYPVTGRRKDAYDFDGVNDYISVPHNTDLDASTTFTVAGWVKTNEGGVFIIKHHENLCPNCGYQLGTQISGVARWDPHGSISEGHQVVEGTSIVTDGEWHHIIGILDGNIQKIYVDGQLEDTRAYTATPATGAVDLLFAYSIRSPPYPDPYTKTVLDEVAIWSRALTPTEATTLYESYFIFSPSIDKDLISYWPFDLDEGSTQTVTLDIVGGNDGTIVAPLTYPVNGIKEEAYEYNNAGRINIANEANFDFISGESITISAWVNASDLAITSGESNNAEVIVAKGTDDQENRNFYLAISSSTSGVGRPFFSFHNGNTNIVYFADNDVQLEDEFHHIALTHTYGSTADTALYVDGQEVSGSWAVGGDNLPKGGDVAPNANNVPVTFGSQTNPVRVNEMYQGAIDEVAIWGRALTSTEVQQVYTSYILALPFTCFNLEGVEITSAEVGDTVLCVYDGIASKLEIYEDDTIELLGDLFDDEIRTDSQGNAIPFQVIGGQSYAYWTITQQDYDAADDVNDPPFEIYFKVILPDGTTIGPGGFPIFGYGAGGVGSNTAPNAVIIAPSSGIRVKAGTLVSFEQRSRDPDDLMEITWDFGDGTSQSFNSYLNNPLLNPAAADTTHAYSSSGFYQVVLTAREELPRFPQLSDTDFVSVAVFELGINVHPVITDPVGGVGYGNFVDFNASQSYVANCVVGTCASANCFQVEDLSCTYTHAPGTPTTPGYDIDVNWTFTDGIVQTLSGDWAVNYSEVVEFTQFFADSGQHMANLKLTYTP